MYEVSFSELKTWRTCRQMYHYKYRERLEPRLKSPALKRGAWMHSLLEAYYKGEDWRETHRSLVKQFNELLEEEKEYYGDLPSECEYLMSLYAETYRDKPILVEHEFEKFPISPSSKVLLKGRIDLVIEDPKRGIWLVEHKTASRIPNEDERLVNPQVALYIPVVERILGTKVQGVLWDYIRTKIPKRKESKLLERRYLPANEKIISQLLREVRIAAIEAKKLTNVYRSLHPLVCRLCGFKSLCMAELMGLDASFVRRAEYKVRGESIEEKEDVGLED